MPVIQAKCENCQGNLEIDSSRKSAFCPYCGTPYLVEDAVNHYHNHVEHLHAGVVNMVDERSSEMRLRAGETFLKQQRYDSAKQAFAEVCNITPQNYLGWWGQIRAITHEFTLRPERLRALNELKELFDSAFVVAVGTQKKQLQEKYDTYYLPLRQKTEAECAVLKRRMAEIDARLRENKREYEMNRPKYKKVKGLSGWIGGILTILLVVGIIRTFLAEDSMVSWMTIVPVVVFLSDKIFCLIYNQTQKSKDKRKARKQKNLWQEEQWLNQEYSKAQNRLSALG